MAFFNSAIGVLQTLVVALGAGLGVWGAINLLEGYGNDNPGAKSQGMKHLIPCLGACLCNSASHKACSNHHYLKIFHIKNTPFFYCPIPLPGIKLCVNTVSSVP